ncbi:MAG: hypothetical protein K2I01_05865, partial [Lachnospiraceae bacterium]|nr:hypothetical protein [Lachnospiraceae bacterium]
MLELKKIKTVKKLYLLLGFFLLYFLLVLKPHVMVYAGSWQMEAGLAEEIVSQYGLALLPEEFEQLKGQKPLYEAGKTDIFIEQNPEYAALQVHSLKELMNLMGGRVLSLEEENRLWFQLYKGVSSEVVTADMERLILFDIWDYYIESYEQAVRGESQYENLTPQALKRVEERNKKEVYSPLPGNVTTYNFELLRYFAVFMMVSTTFFVMPYMVSENRSRMPALQYSFRKGRYYYQNRMAAVVITVLCIAAVECALYLYCAGIDRVFAFWNCALSGFASGFISWLPWTLGSYTVCVLLLMVLASVGLSLIVFVITNSLSSHVSAIAWQIPVAVFSCVYGGLVCFKAGEIDNPMLSAPAVGLGVFAVAIL